ncbi:MAG TPA: threonine ammonia-lyase [Hyphomicrobiaceae bacterium]|nr:threonine ammonia-lyase [Hyphomicrobiaceae bacterium]
MRAKQATAAGSDAPAAVTLGDVEAARVRLTGALIDTDCNWSRTLSDILGCKVWLKFENQQFTASFKERGALNRLSLLKPAEKARGVIAMSAGNHAQGVAYHAHRLAIPATIVMPVNTPTVKVVNTRRHGAEVVLTGETVEEAAAFAQAHGRERGLTFIHPYDDPSVIAGQGTLALEMLGAAPEIDTFVVPIGGGGLISGMAVAATALKPGIRLIGVEAELYPSMYNAINGTQLPMRGDTLADGIAVKAPGHITQGIVRELVEDIVLVSEQEIERAVSLLINIEKTVVEGAGAAGLAAVLKRPEFFKNRTIGLVLCGGNIDTRLLASVLARELAREGRLTQLTIDLVDRPGRLAKVANLLGEAGANIVEVYHQRIFSDLPAKAALLELVIETRDRDHLNDTVKCLKAAGFAVEVRTNPGGTR